MIKHQVTCKACKLAFILQDAKECKHRMLVGIGSTQCPNCGHCICHGETYDEINANFKAKRKAGKHIALSPLMWVHKTAKEVTVGDKK